MGSPNIVQGFSYHIYRDTINIAVNWYKNIIQHLMVVLGGRLCTVIVQVSWNTGILPSLEYVWDMSSNGSMQGNGTAERFCMVTVQVLRHTALQVSRIVFQRDLEMAGHLIVTKGKGICTVAIEAPKERALYICGVLSRR